MASSKIFFFFYQLNPVFILSCYLPLPDVSSITELKFLSDNMDLVAVTSAASFHVSCSNLRCSPEFCLLLHTIQIGLLSQSLLFGRLLILLLLL